jgi:hypothetical protein
MLKSAMQAVFIPTEQQLHCMRTLIEIVVAKYLRDYSSERDFQAGVVDRHLSANGDKYVDPGATLITGLSGGGKSALLDGIGRVLIPGAIKLPLLGEEWPIHPLLLVRLTANSAQKALFADAFKQLNKRKLVKSDSLSQLSDELAQVMYVHGVGALTLDELQFLSLSTGSTSKAVQLLVHCLGMGSPLIYCANYSLVHKLLKQPSEQKQRLISSVIELYPEPFDSPDFVKILAELQKVAPTLFEFDPANDAQEIFQLTAGPGRMLRHLLVASYKLVCNEKKPKVTLAVMKQAFRSADFTSDRVDVQAIMRIGVEGGSNHPDLRSPFPKSSRADAFFAATKKARAQQDALAAVLSTLPAEQQRAIIKEQRKAAPAKVLPLKRSKEAADDRMEAATRRFIESSGKGIHPCL